MVESGGAEEGGSGQAAAESKEGEDCCGPTVAPCVETNIPVKPQRIFELPVQK